MARTTRKTAENTDELEQVLAEAISVNEDGDTVIHGDENSIGVVIEAQDAEAARAATQPDVDRSHLVAAVIGHASFPLNYRRGWDVLVEAWTEEQILEHLTVNHPRVRTEAGAVRCFYAIVDAHIAARQNAAA